MTDSEKIKEQLRQTFMAYVDNQRSRKEAACKLKVDVTQISKVFHHPKATRHTIAWYIDKLSNVDVKCKLFFMDDENANNQQQADAST